MDNTELHYLTYDPDEIWNDMIMNYVDAGGDILYPGDEKEMLLRSVLADIVQVFATVDNALRMQTLYYAEGEFLDLLGERRGCERLLATAATATVTITTNATGSAKTIAAGTAMTADSQMFYQLTEDLVLDGTEQTLTATVECSQVGSAGNGLYAGVAMQLATPDEAINQIVVATDASGGEDEEEDDVYRERIRTYGLAAIATGPRQQYEAAAKKVSTEITDARALGASDISTIPAGEVHLYLAFSDDTGKAAIMQAVEDALSEEDVRPLTDKVVVHEAVDVPYILNVQYQYDSSTANVATAVQEAAAAYKEWQEGTIGLAFNPDRLMAALYQAGCTRVIWGGGSSFNTSGAVQYTEIEKHQRCKGTITLTAVVS
jgi:phage-related baseplate assembly protein